ncbi:hypothetical protein [Marinactinospora rubrisoli]|uniref:Uncharacterized protein n=1 Tax=Marinactinospora rubrisoli TaxID=2715399 RepID=A0ABW2KL09_9ACTN
MFIQVKDTYNTGNGRSISVSREVHRGLGVKFEVVEPADWDDAAAASENAGETAVSSDFGADAEAEPRDPQARLRASTARLRTQVREDVAGLGASIARLMARVAEREAEMADSGQIPAGMPPANFRADRFGTGGR